MQYFPKLFIWILIIIFTYIPCDKNFLCSNDSNDINEIISQSKSDFDKIDNYETNDYFPIEMNPSSLDLEELVENNSDFIKHEQKNQNKKKLPFKIEIPNFSYLNSNA